MTNAGRAAPNPLGPEAEIERLAALLHESEQKLQLAKSGHAAGDLPGSLAHDFNNVLGVIIANLDLLSEQLRASPEAAVLAQEALTAAVRGSELAQTLLAHAAGWQQASGQTGIPTETPGGDEIVLVVDDNAALRRVVGRQLVELGYTVLEAEDGPAALMVLNSETVHLLFTDVVMPGGLSGYDLARLVLSRWPTMKALITSGFPDLWPDGDSASQAKLQRLIKPYRKSDLAIALRNVLDA